jgi:hypothetical protein
MNVYANTHSVSHIDASPLPLKKRVTDAFQIKLNDIIQQENESTHKLCHNISQDQDKGVMDLLKAVFLIESQEDIWSCTQFFLRVENQFQRKC